MIISSLKPQNVHLQTLDIAAPDDTATCTHASKACRFRSLLARCSIVLASSIGLIGTTHCSRSKTNNMARLCKHRVQLA